MLPYAQLGQGSDLVVQDSSAFAAVGERLNYLQLQARLQNACLLNTRAFSDGVGGDLGPTSQPARHTASTIGWHWESMYAWQVVLSDTGASWHLAHTHSMTSRCICCRPGLHPCIRCSWDTTACLTLPGCHWR